MSIEDLNANEGIDKVIKNIKSNQPSLNPNVFSDDLSEAKIERESKKIANAKMDLFGDLSAISTFNDHYYDTAISVEYATDNDYNIIKDLSKAVRVDDNAGDLFARAVSNFYDPESYFPTITLNDNKLEMNIDECSFILDIKGPSIKDQAIQDIIKKTKIIEDAKCVIKTTSRNTHEQSVLLRTLHEKLSETDKQNNTSSADYFVSNIDTFKRLYADMTSEDGDKVQNGLSMFNTLNKQNYNDQSAITAIMSSFDMFHNEIPTAELRAKKIKSISAARAEEIRARTADFNWDESSAQFDNDVKYIGDGIDAEKAGVNTKGIVEEISRKETIKKGLEAAQRNPFALAYTKMQSNAPEGNEPPAPDISKANNVINVFPNNKNIGNHDVSPEDNETPSNVIRVKFK